ncbi:helix-turn-helix transcriptional regulator [Ferrovibrio sp.]|uniref:helix-turn-helix transcriptional regulator n=1 Tax=Ferrovibrio sp. TaxID=1917215 RepID=UPI003D2A4C2F
MDVVQFSSLIEALYEAALVPTQWNGMAQRIAAAFDAPSCALQIRDTASLSATRLSLTDNYDTQANSDYVAHFYQHDPYVKGGLKAGIGVAILGQEVISKQDYIGSEIYHDFGKRLGICHLVGAMLPVSSTVVGGIGIHRPAQATAFDLEDKANFIHVMPHVTRALQLHNRLRLLQRDRAIGFDALEALRVGIMVVGFSGRLLFANRAAETLLRQGQGIAASHGYLRTQVATSLPQLQRAIRDAARMPSGASRSAGGLVLAPRGPGPHGEDRAPLSLLVCPAPGNAMGSDLHKAAAVIFINNPDDERSPGEAVLMTQFRFTPAETRLAAALLDGEQLEEYAERASLSLHTVKSQLRQVFAKAGVSRQAEFIRKALSNPILRLCREPQRD